MLDVVCGFVSRAECRALGRSFVFHVDREYLADLGCLARVAVWGRTFEVYWTAEPAPLPRIGTVVACLGGAAIIPSPFWDWSQMLDFICHVI